MSSHQKRLLILASVAIMALLAIRYRLVIYEVYLITFHQSGIIKTTNKNGKLDGRFTAYVRGKRYAAAYFENGVRDGSNIIYYGDGHVKREATYQNGLLDGTEKAYYANGELDYIVEWIKGKRTGEEYHYLNTRALDNYGIFDQEDEFFAIAYDTVHHWKIKNVFGNIIGPNLYIRGVLNYQWHLLTKTAENISDLNFKIANPPLLKLKVNIWLNNTQRTDFILDAGTVKLKNAFKAPGKYAVRIEAVLLTEANHLLKKDTVQYLVNKK